jgi:hypothetical protein
MLFALGAFDGEKLGRDDVAAILEEADEGGYSLACI